LHLLTHLFGILKIFHYVNRYQIRISSRTLLFLPEAAMDLTENNLTAV